MDKKRIMRLFNRKAWGEIISAFITTASVILDAMGVAKNVPWQWIALAGFVVFAVLVYRRMGEYIERNETFENARPAIVAKPPRIVEHDIYRRQVGSDENHFVNSTATITTAKVERIDRPFFSEVTETKKERYGFVVVDFINEPVEPTEFSVAKSVAAWVSYYRDGTAQPVIDNIPGRWWNKPELKPGEDPAELEAIDIKPNKQKATLALAFKGRNERTLFAYNNESHKVGIKEFRKPEFLLGSGKYNIRVILAGTHLKDSEFWFSVSVDKDDMIAA